MIFSKKRKVSKEEEAAKESEGAEQEEDLKELCKAINPSDGYETKPFNNC